MFNGPQSVRNLAVLCFPDSLRVYPEIWLLPPGGDSVLPYFVGICAAPEAGTAGGPATAALLPGAGTEVPGIWAAPEAGSIGIAGAVTAAPSRTLPLVRARALPK